MHFDLCVLAFPMAGLQPGHWEIGRAFLAAVLITFISATRKCTRHATSQNDTARHTQRCKESVDGERVPLPALARTHTRRRTRARTRTHMYIRTCTHLRTHMRTNAARTHGGEGGEGVGRGCGWRGRRGCGPRLCAARAWAARAAREARVWAVPRVAAIRAFALTYARGGSRRTQTAAGRPPRHVSPPHTLPAGLTLEEQCMLPRVEAAAASCWKMLAAPPMQAF